MKATASPITAAPLAKLIRSSIYKVNGVVCRYTGNSVPATNALEVYGFSNHGKTITATMASVERVTAADIATYFGK